MKRAILILTYSLICITCIRAEKYALIVALSHFASHDIHPLNSTNDVPFVKTAYEKQGFKAANIIVLTDSLATKGGVTQAITSITDRCKPGDIVWMHFTTHGALLEDFDGYAVDGYAKVLVLYDSPKYLVSSYKGEKHLKDIEIKLFSEKIRTKLGPKGELAVTIDACHSGALMRGVAQSKGLPDPIQEPGYDPIKKAASVGIEGFYATLTETHEQEMARAPYVFFSACRSKEVCLETVEKTTNKSVGPLSLALSHVLVTATPGCTFRDLFSRIVAEMNTTVPHQTPVASGNGLDKVILGGDIKPRVFTYPVRSVSGDTVEVGVGTFTGIYEHTEFEIYRIDDVKHLHVYRKGKVIAATPFTSKILLEKGGTPVTKAQLPVLEALVSKKSFGTQIVKVWIDEAAGDKEKAWLKDMLQLCVYAKLTDSRQQADLVLRVADHKKVQVLYALDDQLIREVDIDFDQRNAAQLIVALSKYMQGNAIKKLKLDNPFIYVESEIFAIGTDTAKKEGGIVTAHAGKDKIVIRVTNSGSRTVYINILDIEPSGAVNPVFPKHEMDQVNYRINPTKTFTETFDVSPPYGMESIKIILSEEDVNLGVLAASQGTRGVSQRDPNPVEMLFKDIYGTGTRGVDGSSYKMDNASTVDLNFKIEP